MRNVRCSRGPIARVVATSIAQSMVVAFFPSRWTSLVSHELSVSVLRLGRYSGIHQEARADERGQCPSRFEAVVDDPSTRCPKLARRGVSTGDGCGTSEPAYRRITAPDEKFRFALAAPNGQVVGGSESYETEDAGEDGIQSVKMNAPDAEVKDLADFRPL